MARPHPEERRAAPRLEGWASDSQVFANPAAFMVPLVALAYGGLSAGVGAGIDAMISSEQVIYARRSSAIGLSLRF